MYKDILNKLTKGINLTEEYQSDSGAGRVSDRRERHDYPGGLRRLDP